MQRCIAHRNTTDKYRRQTRHRSQGASATHLKLHIQQLGHFFLSGKLPGNGPARGFGDKAQSLLQGQIIDLIDDAVDIVAELISAFFHALVIGFTGSNALHGFDIGINFKAPTTQCFEHIEMAVRSCSALKLANTVGTHFQGSAGGNF